MPDFSPIIAQAYERILGRAPDPGGLIAWNRSMNEGLSEAGLREAFLRSAEYAQKHPDRTTARARARREAPSKSGKARGRARSRK
jgi:predicted solute-binding protein